MSATAPSASIWSWSVNWSESFPESRADSALLRAIQQNLGQWEGPLISCSRSQLQRLIEEGQVTAAGKPIKANVKFKPGTQVKVQFPAPQPTQTLPEDRPLEILFQDEHLLVLNKPPGLTVHPSSTQTEGTLVNALLHHIKDLSGIGGELRPGIVHRIDKDTSGALVISKTDAAHRKLVEIFSKHEIDRVYWALVYGAPKDSASHTLNTLLGRNPKDRKKMAILPSGGRRAITHYRKVEEYASPKQRPFASWMEVTLETGRTHQIRVHLTSIHHSLLGDPVYGTPSESQPKWSTLPKEIQSAVRQLPGQALHARVLGFRHPITGAPLRFEAQLPPAFQELLHALQNHRDR